MQTKKQKLFNEIKTLPADLVIETSDSVIIKRNKSDFVTPTTT